MSKFYPSSVRFSFFIGLILMSLNLQAQPGGGQYGRSAKKRVVGAISGKLIDSLTNDPVTYASIALKRSGYNVILDGTISDDKGHFKLQEINLGTYDVEITFIGYQTKVIKKIKLTKAKPDNKLGTVLFAPDNVTLDEVEIEGQRTLVENKIDRIVYNAEDDASTTGGDAADVLRKVPMLSVDQDGNVSLKGSTQVRILVNNKPSGLFAGNVGDALKMFPADEIKKVEVITTPSAKYDGEGTGGIINIITKKSTIEGINGNVATSVGTRQNRLGLNLNVTKGRFGLNAGGGAHYSWPNEATNLYERIDTRTDGTKRTFVQNGNTLSSRVGFRGKVGAFYDINAYNSINTNLNIRGFSFDREGTLKSLIDDITDQSFERTNDNQTLNSGYDWNVDYTRLFDEKDREFVIAGQLNGQISRDDKVLSRFNTVNIDPFKELNKNEGDNLEATIQVDYTHPFSKKVKMEIGAKSVIRNIVSDYVFEEFDFTSNAYVPNAARGNVFDYNQNVYAGYTSFTFNLGKNWSAIAGVRYEATDITGSFEQREQPFDNAYNNFLPHIILSKRIGFSTLKASYNKRIQRPSLFYINPYANSEDRLNITTGNPLLKPELSDQFEFGYSTFLGGTVIAANLYYRNTNDVIQSYLSINDEGLSLTKFGNIGTNSAIGGNIFTSVSLKNNLTLRANLDLYRFNATSNGEFLQKDLSNSGWIYKAFLNGTLTLKKGWRFDAFALFNSPRRTIQGYNPSFSMMYFGLNKEIWNKRGTIGLTTIDPFNRTKAFNSRLEGPNFTQRFDYNIPFRSFGISFSYRFGKLDFKSTERKSKIKNDDSKSGEGGDNNGGGFNNGN